MTIPACYYPAGLRQPGPRIRLSQVVGHGLMAHPPAAYVIGARPLEDPPVSSDEVEAFFERHPEATCATRTAIALAYVERFRP